MSGKTAFQKIVDTHCAKTLSDGSMVLRLDMVWGHEITPPPGIIDAQERGFDVVFNPNRVKMMIDHVNPAKDKESAIQGQIVRNWSKKHQVEFLDVGRNGICHRIIPEAGWVRPGQTAMMPDSHTCSHGAFGAFTAGGGTTDWEVAVITGLFVCPPQKVIRVNFVGSPLANIYGKDLILAFIHKIGVKGATNAVLEFGGSVIDAMKMEDRISITNMAVEAGATCGMMPVDEKMVECLYPILGQLYAKKGPYLSQSELAKHMASEFNSDSDAVYDQVIEIDASEMAPMITNNYSPGDVVHVSELENKPINQVFIGSCTLDGLNGLRTAAEVIEVLGGKIADSVRCVVIPATQHIYELALRDGTLGKLAKAGCFISGPSCGACLGMSCGVLAPGEVCVSTSNRNFPGRMGEDGMVHLASAATAAMSAVFGCVMSPTVKVAEEVKRRVGAMPNWPLLKPTDWKDVEFKPLDYEELAQILRTGQQKHFSGSSFMLPKENVDTDQIIPAIYLNKVRKSEFGEHCLEQAGINPDERRKLFSSKVLVSKENFGCGSSREAAPWALEGAGITCVIAPSFARIFENNMFANGLLCIKLDKELIAQLLEDNPCEIQISWEQGIVGWKNFVNSACFVANFELSDHQKNLIRNGGSVVVMIKMAAELQKEGKLV